MNKIYKWAKAIEHWEGASPLMNNPGNMKYSNLTASWGATQGRKAGDGGFFCQFPIYEMGFNALCNFLTLGAKNQLSSYHNARTLEAFTKIYAGNPPQGYINGIAGIIGVSLDTNIATFLIDDTVINTPPQAPVVPEVAPKPTMTPLPRFPEIPDNLSLSEIPNNLNSSGNLTSWWKSLLSFLCKLLAGKDKKY